MIPNWNDGSKCPPRLVCCLSELSIDGMRIPGDSDILDNIRAAGYEGIQVGDRLDEAVRERCQELKLMVTGSGRVNLPADAGEVASRMVDSGITCGTLHVGWGMEDERDAGELMEAVGVASNKYKIPLYVETHRATVFQDIWRTVQLLKAWPAIRVNGDFSHWYTGLEMVYGGFEKKLEFIAPVMDRVAFLHGRIGNPGCMQVNVGEGEEKDQPYVTHFRAMWTASMRGFLARAKAGDILPFASELLAPGIFYARTFGGKEESDRWKQSLVLCRIARECFAVAERG